MQNSKFISHALCFLFKVPWDGNEKKNNVLSIPSIQNVKTSNYYQCVDGNGVIQKNDHTVGILFMGFLFWGFLFGFGFFGGEGVALNA